MENLCASRECVLIVNTELPISSQNVALMALACYEEGHLACETYCSSILQMLT